MSYEPPTGQFPQPPDAVAGPEVGTDEWVAKYFEREEGYSGRLGGLRRRLERVPPGIWLLVFVASAGIIPLLTSNDYVIRVGADTLIFMLLALGLNIVVGWAGMLDLGYVAFFGIGAYLYAILSSDKFDIHWPAIVTVPIVVVTVSLFGLLLGLPSRRLLGDYLAIVTLFFLQIFVTLANNANRLNLPFIGTVDYTGGPNGIPDVDAFNLFGYVFNSNTQYYYLGLGVFAILIAALWTLNASRTGRAWRALREDSLAAELMSVPVNWLRLLAFAFGAGVAGLTGTIAAPLHTGVFPTDFDLPLLITVYAMVILGGSGSLVGVAVGAIVINVSLEVLTVPEHARWLFYGGILLSLVWLVRPWRWLAGVLVGTALFGVVVHELAERIWERGVAFGAPEGADLVTRAVDSWVLLPSRPDEIAKYAYVALIASVLALTLVRGRTRLVALVPILYLAAFVWENLLVQEPSVTRLILLGALLVALMAARPEGLFGAKTVEIV